MSSDGVAELKARLKAIRTKVVPPAAKAWQDVAVSLGNQAINSMSFPYSGAKRSKPQLQLRGSVDVKRTKTGRVAGGKTKAVVVASYHQYFVDAGVKPHSLGARPATARRHAAEGRTIFSRKSRKPHPGYRARPFRGRVARAAYDRANPRQYVYKAWNEAA